MDVILLFALDDGGLQTAGAWWGSVGGWRHLSIGSPQRPGVFPRSSTMSLFPSRPDTLRIETVHFVLKPCRDRRLCRRAGCPKSLPSRHIAYKIPSELARQRHGGDAFPRRAAICRAQARRGRVASCS
jgi:hypothetical protein